MVGAGPGIHHRWTLRALSLAVGILLLLTATSSVGSGARANVVAGVTKPGGASVCTPDVGRITRHFIVWYCDPMGKRRVPAVAAVAEAVYSAEVTREPEGLGPPRSPPFTGRIDLYVMRAGVALGGGICGSGCLASRGSPAALIDGQAYPIDEQGLPDGGSVASGLIIFNENATDPLRDIIAHEFFHILEYAHSVPSAHSWLGEATAEWSERLYGSGTSRGDFFSDFQDNASLQSLDTKNTAHEYGAMVWPLWLEQVGGSKTAVFELWKNVLPAVTAPGQVDAVIDQARPWDEDFLSFAIEDLDLRLGRATPHVFSDTDRAIDLDQPPPFVHKDGFKLSLAPSETPVSLPHLTTLYDYVKAIQPKVKLIQFDFSDVTPDETRAAAVVADTDKGWQSFPVGQDGSLTFCRLDPGQNVSKFYVVLANTGFDSGLLGGRYRISTLARCPGREFATGPGLGGQPTVSVALFADGALSYSINHPLDCAGFGGYATGTGHWFAGGFHAADDTGPVISNISGGVSGLVMQGLFQLSDSSNPDCQDHEGFTAHLVGKSR